MTYPAAASGAALGMMLALVVFANAWRFGYLPRDYDFIHAFGKALTGSDRKPVTYAARFAVGIVFHPVLFVFVWGRDGLLDIYPLQSDVLSAVILVTLEAAGFGFLLRRGIPFAPPPALVDRLIALQFAVHLMLGALMGLTYQLLA